MFQAAAAALGSSALSFGSDYASMLLSAETQRDLRRSQYQDQMHSMKEAGLNPILAYGGSPGSGSAPQMRGGGKDAATSASDLLSASATRKLQKHQEGLVGAQQRKAEAEATTAEAIRDAQKAALEAKAAEDQAQADTHNQNRDNVVAKTRSEYERTAAEGQLAAQRRDRGFTDAQIRDMNSRAGAADASAYEHRQRGLQVERDQPEYLVGEEGGRVWRGANKGIETLGSGARAALGLVPRGRSIDFSAKRVRDNKLGTSRVPSLRRKKR